MTTSVMLLDVMRCYTTCAGQGHDRGGRAEAGGAGAGRGVRLRGLQGGWGGAHAALEARASAQRQSQAPPAIPRDKKLSEEDFIP